VALARALVRGDGLILFDEPLSNVDAKVREQLRLELVAMQRKLGFSALFVTHDQVEAMELASDIAVMREGRVAQFAPPRQVYQHPKTRYVANFIGTTNELVGTLASRSGDDIVVDTAHGPVQGVAGVESLAVGDEVVALWRPERSELSEDEPPTTNRWQAGVQASVFVGSHTEHVLDADGQQFRVWRADHTLLDTGSLLWISVEPRFVRVLGASEPTAEVAS
jgi:iron(III) transport system ATP-binding protein